jgi:acetoacetyl-CoA synthetase
MPSPVTPDPPRDGAGRVPTQLADFRATCESLAGRSLADPADLQSFSVQQAPHFWRTLLHWSGVPWSGSADTVLVGNAVETARFFPDVTLNYAEALLRRLPDVDDDHPALTAVHADRPAEHLTRGELRAAVARTAVALAGQGAGVGDRVVAIAPNNAPVLVAVLAIAAIGATVSTATPDMGAGALLGRFRQTEPVYLLLDRAGMDEATVTEVVAGLPTLHAVLLLDDAPLPGGLCVPVHRLADLVSRTGPADPAAWPRLPFAHPLFVMFSSGTTGPPKAMVHGAGGTLLEHVKEHRLHGDLRPADTLYFHTTTAWMMWNWQLSALAVGAHVVVYDGPITGPETLWELVADHRVTVFGTSPAYLQLCQDEGYHPAAAVDLSRVRSVLSTGAVLHDWQFDWVAQHVGPVPLQSISGGTDIIGCFLLGHPELPVRTGRCQTRSLGLDVVAVDENGAEIVDAIGELVCRRPFPSRPVGFLQDPDGDRFHRAYFAEHPGVWTHGDLVEFSADGSARVHGRSDGVLNVNGVRIGPAEVYTALREVPAVADAMAVEQRDPAQPGVSRMVLLVVLTDGARLDAALERDIRRTLRRRASAAHVPSLVVAVPDLPLTHNGKRSERAARDTVNGDPVANLSALRNPDSLAGIRAATLAAHTATSAAAPEPAAPVTPAPTAAENTPASTLARIWEETLGLTDARPDDDFFDLGGTSRQVMSLFHRVREEIGADLPVTDFFTRPTLAALARSVDAGRATVRDDVVLLRPGRGRPLHLLAEAERPMDSYGALVRELDVDRPVYGLRPRLGGEDGRSWTVEEIADQAVAQLRAVQPAGPYTLLAHGWSGLIAHEAAGRLRQRGESVDLLGLIDSAPPAATLNGWGRTVRRWAGRLGTLRSPDRAQALWQRFVDRFAPATTSPERQALLHARAVFERHRPTPYDGPVVSFVGQHPLPLMGNGAAGWRRAAPALVVTEVRGGPADLHSDRFVGPLADLLSAALR